jgi:hypothetical protein
MPINTVISAIIGNNTGNKNACYQKNDQIIKLLVCGSGFPIAPNKNQSLEAG